MFQFLQIACREWCIRHHIDRSILCSGEPYNQPAPHLRLLGLVTRPIVFHEFMPDIMDFGLFSCERSYEKSCLKNIVKNIVKLWKISMNSSLNLLEFMVQCADAQYLTGPGHSAAAAPEPPASLSACLFQQLQSKYTSKSEPYL